MDLTAFAADVGVAGPVAVVGLGTRGGPPASVRTVSAPSGIDWFQPDEMTVCCGAGMPVDELSAALADHRQTVALPPGGTVGGALAVGHGALLALGHGPVRDALLQARYVSAVGETVTAGGPTVKNVSGFDVCRLLVGSHGSLGLLGEVILRTRPMPAAAGWYAGPLDPFSVMPRLYRPAAVLWDGTTTWARLEGHPRDLADQALATGLREVDGPPALPDGGRCSIAPSELATLPGRGVRFVAEIGVGVVHLDGPVPDSWRASIDPAIRALERRIKTAFDPSDRFGPRPGVGPAH